MIGRCSSGRSRRRVILLGCACFTLLAVALLWAAAAPSSPEGRYHFVARRSDARLHLGPLPAPRPGYVQASDRRVLINPNVALYRGTYYFVAREHEKIRAVTWWSDTVVGALSARFERDGPFLELPAPALPPAVARCLYTQPGHMLAGPADGRLVVHRDRLLLYFAFYAAAHGQPFADDAPCASLTSYRSSVWVRDVFEPGAAPREIVPAAPNAHEKNWLLFSANAAGYGEEAKLLAVYSLEPHVILEIDLDGGRATEFARTSARALFEDFKGLLHLGGGPLHLPAMGAYLGLFHTKNPPFTYENYLYLFDDRPPFQARCVVKAALPLVRGAQKVAFGSGLALDGDRLLVFYGSADRESRVLAVALPEVLATMSCLVDAPRPDGPARAEPPAGAAVVATLRALLDASAPPAAGGRAPAPSEWVAQTLAAGCPGSMQPVPLGHCLALLLRAAAGPVAGAKAVPGPGEGALTAIRWHPRAMASAPFFNPSIVRLPPGSAFPYLAVARAPSADAPLTHAGETLPMHVSSLVACPMDRFFVCARDPVTLQFGALPLAQIFGRYHRQPPGSTFNYDAYVGPEDPRLFWDPAGELVLSYNSNSGDPARARGIWLVNMRTAMPGFEALLPGAHVARLPRPPAFAAETELALAGARWIEKNWIVFRDGAQLLLSYAIHPRLVFALDQDGHVAGAVGSAAAAAAAAASDADVAVPATTPIAAQAASSMPAVGDAAAAVGGAAASGAGASPCFASWTARKIPLNQGSNVIRLHLCNQSAPREPAARAACRDAFLTVVHARHDPGPVFENLAVLFEARPPYAVFSVRPVPEELSRARRPWVYVISLTVLAHEAPAARWPGETGDHGPEDVAHLGSTVGVGFGVGDAEAHVYTATLAHLLGVGSATAAEYCPRHLAAL